MDNEESVSTLTTPETHSQMRARLSDLRRGVTLIDGKPTKLPKHQANLRIWVETKRYLDSRGEFLRAPLPYYHDKVDHRLIPLAKGDPHMGRLLRSLGLLHGEPHTTMVAGELINVGGIAPERPVHRVAHFTDDAMYIRSSEEGMFKVTTDTIEQVHLGADDVLLIADDLGDWPSLDELQPHIDALRPMIGDRCTEVVPGSPMARLTSRWSDESILSAAQQWQMFITRMTFTFAASAYSLWPLLLLTGDGGSGKSTALELFLAMLRGETPFLTSLPGSERDLQASITNSSILTYDNIDGAGLDRDDKGPVNDLLCQVATGALINLRVLFVNNQLARYKVKNHAFLTSRVNPFTRQDVKRRLIELEMAAPDRVGGADRDQLIQAVLADRRAMLAELILRCQNIVRAHAKHANDPFEYLTDMKEYERFTYICASYEGTLEATRKLWAGHMAQYERSITESNPMVFGLRLWLGKGKNAGRQVSPAVLFSELQTVYKDTDQVFPYRSPSQIGKRVSQNLPSLRAIGYQSVRTRNGQDYVFSPSAEELEECKKMYADLFIIAVKRRPRDFFSGHNPERGADCLNRAERERIEQMAYDDLHDMEPYVAGR
jgi:hypothetical protein